MKFGDATTTTGGGKLSSFDLWLYVAQSMCFLHVCVLLLQTQSSQEKIISRGRVMVCVCSALLAVPPGRLYCFVSYVQIYKDPCVWRNAHGSFIGSVSNQLHFILKNVALDSWTLARCLLVWVVVAWAYPMDQQTVRRHLHGPLPWVKQVTQHRTNV